jgi:hypothetical protein
MDFDSPLHVARLTKAPRCADVFARRDGYKIVQGRDKLRKIAVKRLKSLACVNLCGMRGEISGPNGRSRYFDAKDATRSRAPGAPAVTARA